MPQAPHKPKDIHSFVAGGTISSYRIIELDADAQEAKQATGAGGPFIGVALFGTDPDPSAAIEEGDVFDAATGGVCHVEYGDTVALGDRLTADSKGRAVATTTDNAEIIGTAEAAGENGEIGAVRINPGRY